MATGKKSAKDAKSAAQALRLKKQALKDLSQNTQRDVKGGRLLPDTKACAKLGPY